MSSVNLNNSIAYELLPTTDKVGKVMMPSLVNSIPNEVAKPAAEVSDDDLRQALEVVNQAVALEQRSLSFAIDDASGRSVIKVMDFDTNELIKQIPTQELLKVARDIKRLQEEMGQSIGLLIDSKI